MAKAVEARIEEDGAIRVALDDGREGTLWLDDMSDPWHSVGWVLSQLGDQDLLDVQEVLAMFNCEKLSFILSHVMNHTWNTTVDLLQRGYGYTAAKLRAELLGVEIDIPDTLDTLYEALRTGKLQLNDEQTWFYIPYWGQENATVKRLVAQSSYEGGIVSWDTRDERNTRYLIYERNADRFIVRVVTDGDLGV